MTLRQGCRVAAPRLQDAASVRRPQTARRAPLQTFHHTPAASARRHAVPHSVLVLLPEYSPSPRPTSQRRLKQLQKKHGSTPEIENGVVLSGPCRATIRLHGTKCSQFYLIVHRLNAAVRAAASPTHSVHSSILSACPQRCRSPTPRSGLCIDPTVRRDLGRQRRERNQNRLPALHPAPRRRRIHIHLHAHRTLHHHPATPSTLGVRKTGLPELSEAKELPHTGSNRGPRSMLRITAPRASQLSHRAARARKAS